MARKLWGGKLGFRSVSSQLLALALLVYACEKRVTQVPVE